MPNPINTNKASARFVANGTITDFYFNFIIFDTKDVEVYLNSTLQIEGFSIYKSATSDGGHIAFTTAPQNGTIVTIARNLAVKRTTNFSESKAFRAKMLNHEFDYQVACLDQITDNLKRNISIPVYADSNVSVSLPLPEAGKAILWNSTGTALINSQIDVEKLDKSIAICQSSATTASAAATTATAAAATATAATNNKADKDLANVSTDTLKTKSGTRFYDSGDIEIINNSQPTVAHGLPLTTIAECSRCIIRVDLACTTSANGYAAGNIVSAWGLSCATGYVDVPMTIHSLTLSTTQWRLTIANGIHILGRTSGVYEKINNDNFRLRVKIWY